MAQEPEQSRPTPPPSSSSTQTSLGHPPPPYSPSPRTTGSGMGYFIVAAVFLVIGLVAGGMFVRSRYTTVVDDKNSALDQLQRNMESTRNNLLRDARALLVKAQEDLGSDDMERSLDGKKYLIRAKDLVDTVRTLATEDAEKSQIDALAKRLKDAEGRDADSAQADITRALSQVDSLMGRKASRRSSTPAPAK